MTEISFSLLPTQAEDLDDLTETSSVSGASHRHQHLDPQHEPDGDDEQDNHNTIAQINVPAIYSAPIGEEEGDGEAEADRGANPCDPLDVLTPRAIFLDGWGEGVGAFSPRLCDDPSPSNGILSLADLRPPDFHSRETTDLPAVKSWTSASLGRGER